MKKLHYSVIIRNVNGKLCKDSRGLNVTSFLFEEDERDADMVERRCKTEFRDYQAVCKEGSQIDIEVRYFNEFTKTYPLLYSFYGTENKFVKH